MNQLYYDRTRARVSYITVLSPLGAIVRHSKYNTRIHALVSDLAFTKFITLHA